jgi:hypothetical protein
MIEQALAVSLFVVFIHLTFQDGEIFGFIGNYLSQNLPEKLHKPVFDCPICMTPWWGSLVMGVGAITGVELFQGIDFWTWLFILAIAAGISTWYVKWTPKDEIDVTNHY